MRGGLRSLRRIGATLAMGCALLGCGPTPPPTLPDSKPMPAPLPPSAIIGPASQSAISYERIGDFPSPGWQVPRLASVAPDGTLVTYLMSESQSDQMALFAFDTRDKSHRLLVRAGDLVSTEKVLSREEELRRERQRQRMQGVTAYAWARKSSTMLLPLGGNVFVRTSEGNVKQLTRGSVPDIDPQICADGSKVGFVRAGELWVVEVESGKERQLTKGAPPGVTRGLSDFNGQEEFGEPSGLWWSPACDAIAFLEVDERGVEQVPIMGYRAAHDLQQLRYPRAGTANPRVKLGIMKLGDGRTTWLELPTSGGWDARDEYIGRVCFKHDGSALYLNRLARSQQRMALVRVDTKTGTAKHLVEEQSATWLELGELEPIEDGNVVWTALRNGQRALELRDGGNGTLIRTLAAGAWEVSHIAGVDEQAKRILFVANKDGVLERQLYAVSFGGGAVERLTPERGVHMPSVGRPEHGWVDIHSALDRPPRAVIYDSRAKAIGEIPVPRDKDFDALGMRPAELITIDGAPELYGALLKPRLMAPGVRYPAVVMVYGGPGVQTILDEWNPRLLWQHLADRGVVVFQLDNRGSAGRGHAFQAPIHHRMGEIELADQLRGLDYLASLDFVDPTRVGIYGHSYGGFVAAMAMLRAPSRFKVGVAGSPVTDWRLYDTGYTERYMSTPELNPAGYDSTELSRHAASLQGKLLLIHALMDENVHFAHTAKLIDALVAADKNFDLVLFPGERHGYRSPHAKNYAYRRVVEYFAEHL